MGSMASSSGALKKNVVEKSMVVAGAVGEVQSGGSRQILDECRHDQ